MFSRGYTPLKFCKHLYTVWGHVRYTQYTNSVYKTQYTSKARRTTIPIPPYFIWLSWWQKTSVKNTRVHMYMCPYTYSTHVYITQV